MEAPVSLGIINRNDSANLGRLIREMRPYVAEIVVTDTGSTDDSIRIAKAAGVDLIQDASDLLDENSFLTSFGKARQRGMEACTQPYFLWLDTDDELVGRELLKDRVDLWERGAAAHPNEAIALRMNYEYSWNDDRSLCIQQFPRERIVRLGDGWFWKRPVHEHLATIQKRSVQYDITGMKVVHLSQGARGIKNDRNLRILKRWLQEGGEQEDPGALYYYLGDEYLERKMWEESIEFFSKCLDAPGVPFGRDRPLYRLLVALNESGQHQKALDTGAQRGVGSTHIAYQMIIAMTHLPCTTQEIYEAALDASNLAPIPDENPRVVDIVRDTVFRCRSVLGMI